MRISAAIFFSLQGLIPASGFIMPEPGKSIPKLVDVWNPQEFHDFQSNITNTKSDKVEGKDESKVLGSGPPRYADYPFLLHGEKERTERETRFAAIERSKNDSSDQAHHLLDSSENENKFILSDALTTIPMFMKDKNRKSRMLENRAYSKPTGFEDANTMNPPMLRDLSPSAPKISDTFWSSIPAGILSFLVPYLVFPYLVKFLDPFISSTIMNDFTGSFGPGVSILYGTFVSLTLSILYKRQDDIQTRVATESSLLSMTSRNLLTLLKNNHSLAVEASQSAADQIRILCEGSRGDELMLIMYNDPYARILQVLEKREEQANESQNRKYSSLVQHCRQNIAELFQLRANRLSNESLALPSNHFFILTSLTVLILFGYTIQIGIESSLNSMPSNESSITFGLLCSIYMLFYNFATDLNDPFSGIYQVRRSATVSHLLQSKWMILNHPTLKGHVDFNKQEDIMDGEDVVMRTPGLDEMHFRHL